METIWDGGSDDIQLLKRQTKSYPSRLYADVAMNIQVPIFELRYVPLLRIKSHTAATRYSWALDTANSCPSITQSYRAQYITIYKIHKIFNGMLRPTGST